MPETKKVIRLTSTQLKEMRYEHIVNIAKPSSSLLIEEDVEKLLYERFGGIYEQLAISWPMINGEFKPKKSAVSDVLFPYQLREQHITHYIGNKPHNRGIKLKPEYSTTLKEELVSGYLFGLYGLPKEVTEKHRTSNEEIM